MSWPTCAYDNCDNKVYGTAEAHCTDCRNKVQKFARELQQEDS